MEKIGRYEIEKEVGRGAMGVVYVAYDPRLRRRVALKTYTLPDGLSPRDKREFQTRFLREAQAAAGLSHPGIVTVYDAGEDQDRGIPYIAMELVAGRSLAELLEEEKRLDPKRVFAMADTLAAALHAAHQAGIVHRDLKPANILVRNEDDNVKIADFGIARISTSRLTRSGSTLGSPGYMSPEQIQGQPIDGRSDLFSLAVILYEALCGEPPFAGKDLAALAYSVVHGAPAPVSSRLRDLPEGLDGFFDRALAKSPGERFPDGDSFGKAMAEALRQVETPKADVTVVNRKEATPVPPKDAGSVEETVLLMPMGMSAWRGEDRPPRFRRRTILVASLILGGLLVGWTLWASRETYLRLDAKSNVAAGTLTLLVDEREVYTRELFLERKGLLKKVVGKAQESFETWIEVDPGKHEVTARVVTEAMPAGYVDTIVVDLKRGETRLLRLSAGRTFGSPVMLRTD